MTLKEAQIGEENRDGSDDNLSYNHGFEGECTNPKIEGMRLKTFKGSAYIKKLSFTNGAYELRIFEKHNIFL